MKPLNRPMFRYGGPIKEGDMSGIREPKKDGGMLLVGQHPKEFKDASGREKHVAPIIYGAGLGLARLAPFAIRAARPVMNFFRGTAPATIRKGLGRTRVPTTMERMSSLFKTSPAGQYLMRSPEGRLLSGGAGYAGKIGRGLLKGGKYLASSPLTLATAGYYGGKALLPDGTPDPNAPGEVEKDPNIGKTTKELGIAESESGKKSQVAGVQDTKPETKAERIQRYRDIMDIKGMNKAAAYDSLIAASKAVGESQDFKGDLKSGKLINQIIQSTSKAFDKPKATKDAIDTLILKGEIEKDIKASDPSNKILNRLREVQIKKGLKDLEGTNFAENKAVQLKAGNTGQSAIDGAAAMDNEDFRGNLVTKSDLSDIIETQKKAGELDEETIVISYTNTLLAKNKDGIADGDYTVGEFLVTIKDNRVYDITR